MRLDDVEALARRLMDAHGLGEWSLALDGAKTRAGVCRYDRRTLGLSRHLMALYDEDEVANTVLHEIAHALVGPSHGHDAVWRSAAESVGATPARCVPTTAPSVRGSWTGTCPNGHQVSRHRRPTRVHACGVCSPGAFDVAVLITWRHHGRSVPMGSRYEAELRAVRRHYATHDELPLFRSA